MDKDIDKMVKKRRKHRGKTRAKQGQVAHDQLQTEACSVILLESAGTLWCEIQKPDGSWTTVAGLLAQQRQKDIQDKLQVLEDKTKALKRVSGQPVNRDSKRIRPTGVSTEKVTDKSSVKQSP